MIFSSDKHGLWQCSNLQVSIVKNRGSINPKSLLNSRQRCRRLVLRDISRDGESVDNTGIEQNELRRLIKVAFFFAEEGIYSRNDPLILVSIAEYMTWINLMRTEKLVRIHWKYFIMYELEAYMKHQMTYVCIYLKAGG